MGKREKKLISAVGIAALKVVSAVVLLYSPAQLEGKTWADMMQPVYVLPAIGVAVVVLLSIFGQSPLDVIREARSSVRKTAEE